MIEIAPGLWGLILLLIQLVLLFCIYIFFRLLLLVLFVSDSVYVYLSECLQVGWFKRNKEV